MKPKEGLQILIKPIFLGLLFSSVVSCVDNSSPAPVKEQPETFDIKNDDSLEVSNEIKEEEPELYITYHRDTLRTKKEVDSFKTKYSDAEEELIYALNRMDARRLRIGNELVVPDTLTNDFLDYSPFPKRLDILDSIPKVVLISIRVQGVGLYENGKLKTWGPASTGKQSTPTPKGIYYGNYKSKRKISTIDKDWIMPFYFNFMNYEGIGTHEYTLPGYPASHGCVRLRKEEAVTIYNWADQWELDSREQVIKRNGTPFMVFGDYDHEKPRPWLSLASDPDATDLTGEEKETLRKYVTEYRKDNRNFAPSQNLDQQMLAMPPEEGLETVR
ncbi:L,D-transpeptidase [Salinimicrobium soli]